MNTEDLTIEDKSIGLAACICAVMGIEPEVSDE